MHRVIPTCLSAADFDTTPALPSTPSRVRLNPELATGRWVIFHKVTCGVSPAGNKAVVDLQTCRLTCVLFTA